MNQINVIAGQAVRTSYMQSLLSKTYESVAIQACLQGTIVGAWEKLIADEIHTDFLNDHSEACEIVNSVSTPGLPATKAYLKAAHLITSSVVKNTI